MPTKGNPIVKLRLEREVIADVEAQIASRNSHSGETPWDLSAFIRSAIIEKLKHMQRSRRGRPIRRAAASTAAEDTAGIVPADTRVAQVEGK